LVFGDEVEVACLLTDPGFFIRGEPAVFNLHALDYHLLLLLEACCVSILVLAPDDLLVALLSRSRIMLGIVVFIFNGQNIVQSDEGT